MKSKTPSASRKRVTKTAKAASEKPVKRIKAAPVRAAAKSKRAPKSPRMKIPPLLLEGDAPTPPAVSGPGSRYALGPTPPAEHFTPAEAELPEAYGTRQLFLTARDPHWLYAYWDFTREQLKKYNALSADGHLVLRVFCGAQIGEPISQIHLNPESRNWFVPVPQAASKYLAELGYYDTSGRWQALVVSGATLTPPDSLADDTAVRFATIPTDVPFEQLLALIKAAVREHVPLAEALQQLRAEGFKNLPGAADVQREEWTPAQEKALAAVISVDQVRRIWVGSLEITELIRRQLQQEVSSISVAQLGLPSSLSFSSVSSPFGGQQRQRGFWFNVNAELIIYGSTEPDATVTIGDRTIKLRSDGSFSFRFALPDGQYSLPAAAHSADGVETRQAELNFSRDTQYLGEVGVHPQDKNLQPPLVSAVA